MPLRRATAEQAFATLKANADHGWPDMDEPDNRFAHFADPSFKPGFALEPGQRIFTIGSCFARGVETALHERGFEVPALSFKLDEKVWGADQAAMLNNYVPPAIAPQIRWAFGMETYDVARHAVEVKPGLFVDLHMPTPAGLILPAEQIVERRETVNAIYRRLAESDVVIVTLGLIEAWFDTVAGLYICSAPRKIATRREPGRFELHVLSYADVIASLRELGALLDRVCPSGYRLLLTVSPVPLNATFTESDVAVANAYSKSALRAAVEEFVVERSNAEYFPSYESVVLTERALAYERDQMHVTGQMVRFNVDRMLARYVRSGEETPEQTLKSAVADVRAGRPSAAMKRLQTAWKRSPDDPKLCVALADACFKAGRPAMAERLLVDLLAKREDAFARSLLARILNAAGRYEEAVPHAEKASEQSGLRMWSSMERVEAYYHLGRYEEGLALANRILFAQHRGATIAYWKARFLEKLGKPDAAEAQYRAAAGDHRDPKHTLAYAEFLGARGRWADAVEWIDATLQLAPFDGDALRLRGEARRAGAPGQVGPRLSVRAAWWWATTALRWLGARGGSAPAKE